MTKKNNIYKHSCSKIVVFVVRKCEKNYLLITFTSYLTWDVHISLLIIRIILILPPSGSLVIYLAGGPSLSPSGSLDIYLAGGPRLPPSGSLLWLGPRPSWGEGKRKVCHAEKCIQTVFVWFDKSILSFFSLFLSLIYEYLCLRNTVYSS